MKKFWGQLNVQSAWLYVESTPSKWTLKTLQTVASFLPTQQLWNKTVISSLMLFLLALCLVCVKKRVKPRLARATICNVNAGSSCCLKCIVHRLYCEFTALIKTKHQSTDWLAFQWITGIKVSNQIMTKKNMRATKELLTLNFLVFTISWLGTEFHSFEIEMRSLSIQTLRPVIVCNPERLFKLRGKQLELDVDQSLEIHAATSKHNLVCKSNIVSCQSWVRIEAFLVQRILSGSWAALTVLLADVS